MIDETLVPSVQSVPAKQLGRRRLMGRVGATALLASAAVFGKAEAASAAGPMCCNLAHNPPNTSWSYCHAHSAYTWYCDSSGSLHCSCCETANNVLSAYECHYNRADPGVVGG